MIKSIKHEAGFEDSSRDFPLVGYTEHTRHPCDETNQHLFRTEKEEIRNDENGHVLQDSLLLLQLRVILPVDVGETPFARNDNLLASRELITSTTESFLYDWCVVVLAPDGEDDLTNVHSRDSAVWFSPSTTHTSLQSMRDVSFVYTQKKKFKTHRSAPAQLNILLILKTWKG
jgi:hypothetical protein